MNHRTAHSDDPQGPQQCDSDDESDNPNRLGPSPTSVLWFEGDDTEAGRATKQQEREPRLIRKKLPRRSWKSKVLCTHRKLRLTLWIARCAMVLSLFVFFVQHLGLLHDSLSQSFEVPTWSTKEALTIDADTYAPISIFYNVYVPVSSFKEKRSGKAFEVIQEQLDQLARSDAGNQAKPAVLFVNTIGSPWVDQRYLNSVCSKYPLLECRHVQHYSVGDEILTLNRIKDFCEMYPANKAVYLHSKGTFHDNAVNTRWRRILTDAVTSRDCLEPPDGQCNVCGFQFYTQWTSFMPGNMWTADCSYVNKLLPLDTYKERLESAVGDTLLQILRNQLTTTLLFERKDFFGLDRYSAEHWIGTHPDIQPCDMDPTGNIGLYFVKDKSLLDLSWSPAPRHKGVVTIKNGKERAMVKENEDLRIREYFLLAGNLLKWSKLYGQYPDYSSWVWAWFPDGEMWRDAVAKHGDDVVEEVTKKYYDKHADVLSPPRSAFAPRDQVEIVPSSSRTSVDLPEGDFAVFYHIATPPVNANEINAAENFNEVVMDQLRIVASSSKEERHNKVPIFCNTFGSGSDTVSLDWLQVSSMCSKYDELDCHPLRHFGDNYEGETLRQLQQFCQIHPHYRVAYIHNQAPLQVRKSGTQSDNKNLIRHLTMAAVSKRCTEALTEGLSCNVCGLIFFTAWMNFFGGNMFATSCEYVNKLIAPTEFEPKMRDFIRMVLVERLRERLTTEVFEDQMGYFGLDRYSMEHWIGSHPSIQPCDLTPEYLDLDFWKGEERMSDDFEWDVAPRHHGSSFLGFNETALRRVMRKKDFREREFTFLAGNLMKWYTLYNETPPEDSWVWSWFPDGEKWKQANEKYGSEVVNVQTKIYINRPLEERGKRHH